VRPGQQEENVGFIEETGRPKRQSSGKKVLSRGEYSRWENEHQQKIRKEGDDDKEALGNVQKCLSLAVKGAVCLVLGIAGICAWPFFCTFSPSTSMHNLFALPFALLILAGVIILLAAGARFLGRRKE